MLNARYHEQEAYIIAQAGRLGAVTIATNMAGRGTDIQLGGNADMRMLQELAAIADEARRDELAVGIAQEVAAEKEKVLAAGGLYVLGTERHESRAASTTSCAAAPAARAIRAAPSSISRSKTT